MQIEGKNYKMRFSNDLFRKVCLEGRLSQMFQILPCSCFVFSKYWTNCRAGYISTTPKHVWKIPPYVMQEESDLKNRLKGFNRMTVRSACIYVDSCISQHHLGKYMASMANDTFQRRCETWRCFGQKWWFGGKINRNQWHFSPPSRPSKHTQHVSLKNRRFRVYKNRLVGGFNPFEKY